MLLAALALSTSIATASPARADTGLDALFAKLSKASSSEDAGPIEKEILLRFLQSGSASVDLLMNRVDALVGGGDAATATKILNIVTRVAPSYAEGWHQRGKLESEAGRDEAAMASLQKTVTLNPREFEAYVELGDMLAEYGAKPAALASYKKALALDPKFEGLDRRVEQLSRDVEGEKI